MSLDPPFCVTPTRCNAHAKRWIQVKATLLDVLDSDDGRVVGVHQNTGERNGKQLDVGCCIVFEIKDGLLVDGREHFFDLYAWDEFWS